LQQAFNQCSMFFSIIKSHHLSAIGVANLNKRNYVSLSSPGKIKFKVIAISATVVIPDEKTT